MADTKDTKKKNSAAPAKSGKKEPKVKKDKKPKVEKLFGYKKLPPLFKKTYSSKAFEKKIDKKLYVPQDKTYISSLFKDAKDKKGNPVLAIPKESQFTKKELKRLKTLAKEIKANKGRFKAVPFIAVAAVIAALVIVVTVFKNPAAKWAIRSTMQGIFGAKCDIGSVNVEILGAQITVNNLAQASSSDEYKNLFQFDKLDLDFNLTDLLRAKFHAENIEITGIAAGTERATSGKLPVKQKSAKEKEEKSDSTGFYESLKAKMGSDPDAAKKAITDLFAMYDPNAIAANIKDNLQSQKVAKEVEEEMKALVEQWKAKPEELKKSVDEVKEATKSLTSLNVSNVSAAEIPALLKQIEEASSKIQSAKSNMETSLSSFSTDQDKIKALQQKLTDAIASDKALLSSQLSVLDVSKTKQAISDSLNQAGYALLGQYYPYLKQLISYAGSMKASSGSSDEAKKPTRKLLRLQRRKASGMQAAMCTGRRTEFLSFLLRKRTALETVLILSQRTYQATWTSGALRGLQAERIIKASALTRRVLRLTRAQTARIRLSPLLIPETISLLPLILQRQPALTVCLNLRAHLQSPQVLLRIQTSASLEAESWT